MPPDLLFGRAARILLRVIVEEDAEAVHGVVAAPLAHRCGRNLATLFRIEVRAVEVDQLGIFVQVGLGEYERVGVAAVVPGMFPLERGIEREAGVSFQLLGEELGDFEVSMKRVSAGSRVTVSKHRFCIWWSPVERRLCASA